MTHACAGAHGTVGDRDGILQQAAAWGRERTSEVLLADASVVFGREHLESAASHAERARASETMATRSLSMEALLYLSGERQVTDAVRLAGIKDGTRVIAVLVFGNAPVEDLLSRLGWARDDAVLDARDKDLGVLGITAAERDTVPEERVVDLALERTALVDLEK
ncbi:MAG TPA: KEOPS complex subunit Cgi121 [Thermoplasmata archaeon]|nr:KEOPS complex subunit Cgi121 [Thermoplasmata archaeon]